MISTPSEASALPHIPLDIPAPTLLKVLRATSPQAVFSPAHSIAQAIDGSLSTGNWHSTGLSKMEGEFFFAQPESMQGIRFVGANFSIVSLRLKRKGKYGKRMEMGVDRNGLLRFNKLIKGIEAVDICIDYGKPNNLALREVEFFRTSPIQGMENVDKVFTDSSCSKLLPNIKKEDLQSIPSILQEIAQEIKEGNYEDAEFRIADYKAYSDPKFARDLLHINALNPFDNPTGIYADQGDELIIFVGPTNGKQISLTSNLATSLHTSSYPLEEGANKIRISMPGLLYINYTEYMIMTAKFPPITVHFAKGSGKVNGYFDISKHTDADWKKMIPKAKHEVFDLVGNQSMMILTTRYLQDYSPEKITNSIKLWDDTIQSIWDIIGFDRERSPINNRFLGFSTEGGPHMFSTEYGCGYSNGPDGYNMRNEVLAPGVATGTRLWGIGHEVGHSHQFLIDWPSMRESSNNFFAQVALDQAVIKHNGGVEISDMENPCKYLLEQAVKGMPFHDMNGWAKWGFAQYSFYLYFHKLGINPEFYPELFASLRKNPNNPNFSDAAECHLNWYERICNESKLDFTDDFETFNWFVPIEHSGHQYGDYTFNMTKEMADAAKARIKAKNYPKPKLRVAFLHQHSKNINLWGKTLKGDQLMGYWKNYSTAPEQQFSSKKLYDGGKLSPKVSARKDGNMVYVSNGENAAAICIKTAGKIVAYYDRPQFDISDIPWDSSSEIYAIPMQSAEPFKLIYSAKKDAQ